MLKGPNMKRFHVHLHDQDLQASIAFYSRLFSAQPARIETDYAKWMLEDPRVNFAISTRGSKPGLDHLGFQVDSAEELIEMKQMKGSVARHHVGQFGRGAGLRVAGQQQVQHRHEMAFATAEAAMQIRRLARVAFHRALDQRQRLSKALLQLRRDHIVGDRFLRASKTADWHHLR
mgnify:CR=1 FL=1